MKIVNVARLAVRKKQRPDYSSNGCQTTRHSSRASGETVLAKDRSQVTTYIVPKHFIAIVLINKTSGSRVEIPCRD